MTVGEFINRERWTFAKTYAKFAPHEYIVRGKCVATDEEFDKFVNIILKHGMRMFYYNHERKYLFVDGWFYWIMRDYDWRREDAEEDDIPIILNRCRPEDYDIVFMRRGTQARKAAKEKRKRAISAIKTSNRWRITWETRAERLFFLLFFGIIRAMIEQKGGDNRVIYTENNVFDEAMNRIRMLFDTHEDIIVSMSGGKDSTVVFNMALAVAKEKDRLPIKVFWLDQEAEWQGTVDYMNEIMRMPEVEPYWFQIPFDFTNSLSAQSNFLKVFDESCEAKWVHPKVDISIKENPTKYNRYHDLVKHLPTAITDKNAAVLVGMRMSESPRRRMSITNTAAKWHGITWCTKEIGNTRKFWPIYDFTDEDIWTAIAKNHWKYNRIYDLMYRWGVPKKRMRVSALIHETAWHSLEMLQEAEPKTYNRFVARIPGSHTFNHAFDESSVVPKTLPFAFKDWKEYRDYLLEHITKPEYRDLFRKRWEGQDGVEWYKIHVKEVIINDIDGTVNDNQKYQVMSKVRLGGKYKERNAQQFREYMEAKKDGN